MEGLIHMDGRVYDSTIGRFVSADIHVPHPYSTQSYNRYSYVRNNPLGFTDPSGYSDADKIPPTITSPENKQSQEDATPTNGTKVQQIGTKTPVAAASVNGGGDVVDIKEAVQTNVQSIVGQKKQEEAIAKERQEYIVKRAKELCNNKRVLAPYKKKLSWLLSKHKGIYYTNSTKGKATGHNTDTNEILGDFYGIAGLRSGTIRIISLTWTQGYDKRGAPNLQAAIDFIILHETKHFVIMSTSHPGGYDNFNQEIRDMGFWTP